MRFGFGFAAAVAIAFLAAGRPIVAEDKKVDGWSNLVGTDLNKNWTTKGNWALDKEGVIALTPREGESGWSRWSSYLWSTKTYGDFEIEFEYTVQKGGNSGFYFRVADVNDPVAKGIEVQIYDSGSKKPGDKLTDHDSGGVIPGIPPTKNTARPAGEWNKFAITVKDDKLTVKLNGEVVNEVNLAESAVKDRPKVGPIGFQDHALPLSLRNIRIREFGK